MPPIPFLRTAQGDPINLRRKIALQDTEDVPPLPADEATAYEEFWSNGGPIAITPTQITPQIIATSGEPLPQLIGKINIGNSTLALGDADPASKAMMRIAANILRKYTHSTMAAPGGEQWQFGVSETTDSAGWLTLLNDSDVLPRQRFVNILASNLEIGASPGENLLVTAQLAVGSFDMFGEVTKEAGTGDPEIVFRGYYPHSFALDSEDKDLYLLFPTPTTYKAKIGAAASYGSQTYTAVAGRWNRIWDEAGLPVGTYAEQAQFYLPATAVIAASDEFKVEKNRDDFGVSALGTRRSISSVSTSFLVNGVETRIDGSWTITINAPDVARTDDVSGRQSSRTRRIGPVQSVFAIEREVADLDFQAALLNATEVSLVAQCQTQVVIPGSSPRPFRLIVMGPAAVPNGDTFDVAVGGRGRTESLEFNLGVPSTAFSFTPIGDTAALTTSNAISLVIQNDVLSL